MNHETTKPVRNGLVASPMTFAIIALNILVFGLLNRFPQLADQLLVNPDLGFGEKGWTLVTVFFSQEHPVHLIVNMGLFYLAGSALERLVGWKYLVLTYLLCGFAGSVTLRPFAAFIGWSGGLIPGASAAAFGVTAAFAVLQPKSKLAGTPARQFALALFVVNAVIFLFNPGMSVGAAAHAVGMLVGLETC